jgi:hypothetical protein
MKQNNEEYHMPSGYPAFAKQYIQKAYSDDLPYTDVSKKIKEDYNIDLSQEDYMAIGETYNNDNTKKISPPASKTKKVILNILAGVFAYLVFIFVKLGLILSGLIEEAPNPLAGGILLLIGLWYMFSGLFLGESKQRNQGLIFVAVYITFSIMYSYYTIDDEAQKINQQFMELNKNLPQKIEDGLELTSVDAKADQLSLKYRFTQLKIKDLSTELILKLKIDTKKQFCKDPNYIKIMNYGKQITESYYDKENISLMDTLISTSECKNNF